MEAKQLIFQYGTNPFIKNLDTKIEKGQITTIIGPNGSGKSTLLNLFVNQLKPENGSILLDGKELSSYKQKKLAEKIAIVYQQNNAPGDITVERLVRYGRTPYQSFFSNKDEEEDQVIDWALSVTKLSELQTKKLCELSGGERQRAWIAMALAQKTDMLFLDEPTTYLDVYYQYEILNLVRELNQTFQMTILMVLHDINQAIQFSDNVIIMKKGRIVYDGPVREGITERRIEEVYGIKSMIQWCEQNKCPYMIPLST
ncbi:iron ABC transporter ATP-binding protein [Anaerocolumna cellulosilytica]|uniref:Iron ABC transporter ATP-binding protein n=1 Tax=Anaerocolumna cellulosilytica TaxID=433286 RepID=A0A6S6QUE8_9FIRM|nr:ABC transporter ATP-binding protein [Anaerocolumna cellulosilytica]MBB5196899.1 iron complex transport system ATP-binding protein [Anaerocolumna cellulosilytica]BCJ92699.1 iron ABC transporter ATP-binding protein [Anaerocolumna cellulosilytica]